MKKNKLTDDRRSLLFQRLFVVLYVISVAVLVIMAMLTRGKSFTSTLFGPYDTSNQDFFMDFFNSVRDASSTDVYEKGVIYPPLANLIFMLFSGFLSKGLADTSFAERYALQMNQQAIITYFMFALSCIVALALIIKYYLKRKNSAAWATFMGFSVIFFYPVFYCVERGNIVLLSMICAAFFVFFHDSEIKSIREISLIMLAVSAGLKIYPAVFGVILLKKGRYKSALRALLYGIVLFFAPFLVYHHGEDVFTFFSNLLVFSGEHRQTFSFSSVSVQNLVLFFDRGNSSFGPILFVICELAALIGVFIVPREWQRYALLTYSIVNIKSVSSAYALVFFIIPFVIFISRKTKKYWSDWLYFALFCIILLPLPCLYFFNPQAVEPIFDFFGLYVQTNVNNILALPAVQLLFVYITVEGVMNFIHRVKNGKKAVSFFYVKPNLKNKKSEKKEIKA